MSRVRIKDIAEMARVSTGTVDRVLHNRGEVSPATREKVQKLLRELDYKTDILASSLALKREVRLAVVMPKSVNEHVFWELPLSGIQRALDELSLYKISVDTFTFDQFSPGDFIKRTRDFSFHKYQGVLFAPVFRRESAEFLDICGKYQLPVVLFNSFLEHPAVKSFVGQDATQSGYVAAKLIHYGLEPGKDVAVINTSSRKDHYAHIISREQGFRSFFEEHGGRLNHLLTIDLHGADDLKLKRRLDALFREYNVSGLFVTNSRVYRVARYLAERGTMSVRLVGYDLLPESVDFLRRDFIDFLISQRPEEQAFRGVSSLFNLVAFNRELPERQLMPIDIITRENLIYYSYRQK